MGNIRKIFAAVIAIAAVMLMQTSVFANVAKSGSTLTLSGNVTVDEVQAYKSDDTLKTIKVGSSGAVFPESSKKMFYGFEYVETIDLKGAKTSAVTDMSMMFSGCKRATSIDVSGFDTSKVTTMYQMFNNCAALTALDVDNFDTRNVTSFSGMFYDCNSLTELDLYKFDTRSATTFLNMFHNCQRLSTLYVPFNDTSNVTTMEKMFYGCSALKQLDVSSFDTSNVKTMYCMFEFCSSLTELDLSKFDTRNVTNMRAMFWSCNMLKTIKFGENFDTSKVVYLNQMFAGCSCLTKLDLTAFDTSSATTTEQMFDYCLGLETLDITGFNLDNISEKNDMFKNCRSLRELKLDANSSIGRSLKLEAPVYISDKGTETTLDTLDDAEYNVITTPTEPTVYYRSDFVDDTLAGLQGSGTKDDPYIVNDRYQFRFIFLKYDKNNSAPLYIKLGKTIDEYDTIFAPLRKQSSREIHIDFNGHSFREFVSINQAQSLFYITGGNLVLDDSSENADGGFSAASSALTLFNVSNENSYATQLIINDGWYNAYDRLLDMTSGRTQIYSGIFNAPKGGVYVSNGKLMVYGGKFLSTDIYVGAKSVNNNYSFIKACYMEKGKIYSNATVIDDLLLEGKSKAIVNGAVYPVNTNTTEISGKLIKIVDAAATTSIEKVNIGVDEPVIGEYVNTNFSTDLYPDYSIKSADWDPYTIAFQDDVVYTVYIELKANEYFKFDENTEFYINDKKAYVESNSGSIAKIWYCYADKGDANLDTYVNDRDAALVLKYINGKATLSKEQKAAANVVGDNEINILDVIAILKKAS